jgi:hypothetical protein
VTGLAFTLLFDSTLLELQDVKLAAGVAGTVSRTAVAGGVRVEVTFSTPLAAGASSPVDIVARVAAGAAYGAVQVLDLADVAVQGEGGEPIAAQDDDALQLAAYLLDADGNQAYSANDLQLMRNVLNGGDTGFVAYRNVDPGLVGDLTGNGRMTSLDANRFLQFLSGQARSEIPSSPTMPPVTPVVTKVAAVVGAAKAAAPLAAPASSTVSWDDTWKPAATTIVTPPAPTVAAASGAEWTSAPWAKDLTQRVSQIPVSGGLKTLLKALVKKL